MSDDITTDRNFQKHRVLGEIFAVEWLVVPDFSREAARAMRCTRPEELTRGALAVLALKTSDDLVFFRANCLEFERWEPPMVNEEKLDAIIEAENVCAEAESAFESAHKAAAAAKKSYEKACDDLRRAVRLAKADAPELPLLAIAEAPARLDEPFDADLENFDHDDRHDEPPADLQHPD